MKSNGIVYLVGAGPGDAGLLTLRGAELLSRAEVVVYDALVNSELLRLAPKSAEIIYGGKRAKQHRTEHTAGSIRERCHVECNELSRSLATGAEQRRRVDAPIGKSDLFPLDIIDMIAVAEESNNLENVLVTIADSYEARTARSIDLMVRLLEPLMLLVMAGVTLIVVAGLLLPIFKMGSAI